METIRTLRADEADAGLELILDDGRGDAAGQAKKVCAFKTLIGCPEEEFLQQVAVERDGHLVYSCLFVKNPGRTAFVFSAPGDAGGSGEETDAASKALEQLSEWAFTDGCNLLEVLLEPSDAQRKELFLRSGYRYLTDLVYLAGRTDARGEIARGGEPIRWLEYSPSRHELFKDVIRASYEGSLDCPELEGIRDMEDVVAGHKGAGVFSAGLWHVVCEGEKPAGAVLLAGPKVGEAMELVYMGLVPSARGRGLGGLLVEKAMACSRQAGAGHLMAAVDCRNAPARRVYQKYGFTPVSRRTVLLRAAEGAGLSGPRG